MRSVATRSVKTPLDVRLQRRALHRSTASLSSHADPDSSAVRAKPPKGTSAHCSAGRSRRGAPDRRADAEQSENRNVREPGRG